MNRPEHLSCVNTAEGIRRINENQEAYDRDPERYEREEREQHELRLEEERQMQEDFARFTPEQEIPF